MEELEWVYNESDEEWTSKRWKLTFSIYFGDGGFVSTITEPFLLSFCDGKWSNQSVSYLKDLKKAKKVCNDYLKNVLHELKGAKK